MSEIDQIRDLHRQRRFAMKLQQKIDRALESFVRINATDWSPDLDAETREKFNKEAKALIKRARAGETLEISPIVMASDQARMPADDLRKRTEKEMTLLAEQLPVIGWVTATEGAGALGLATIVAEAGDLSNYPNVAKLWKRLGFAPYDGFAGSTWKRETWRPRKLTAEEWTDNPFSGERYALMHQVAIWLVNHQWTGAAKTESGEGEPCGPYGEVYGKRRAHTAATHPDWTKMHSRQDALRIAMKAFLRDLWVEWHRTNAVQAENMNSGRQSAFETHGQNATARAPGQVHPDAHRSNAGRAPIQKRGRQSSSEAHPNGATASAPGHQPTDTQAIGAGRALVKKRGRQPRLEAQSSDATASAPGQSSIDAQVSHAGRAPNSKSGRQAAREAQANGATASAPGQHQADAQFESAGRALNSKRGRQNRSEAHAGAATAGPGAHAVTGLTLKRANRLRSPGAQ